MQAADARVYIAGFKGRRQERSLNCEFRTAADLAEFYGYVIDWQRLFLEVGHDPNGDPDVGFVGRSFDDPPGGVYPQGYGVYAEPVARGLRALGVPAEAFYSSPEWLWAQLRAGQPVMIWASSGMKQTKPVTWQTNDGRKTITGIHGEHTFTVLGFDADAVWVFDPAFGIEQQYPISDFLRSWSYLGNMALIVTRASDAAQ